MLCKYSFQQPEMEVATAIKHALKAQLPVNDQPSNFLFLEKLNKLPLPP
jgi:hypothetical protein